MDILFKNDDFVFSYRVGGILKHNGKILLQRPKNDDYAIIGGHVAAMETSMETLKREFEEELHAKIEVDNLLAIGEIYFPWGKRPCHQICLYYNVHGKGVGRKIINTLETDEFYVRASRIEIPASITAMEFYRKFGYDYKNGVKELDNEHHYRLEKFKEAGLK